MNILSTPELLQRIGALVAQATGLAIDTDRMHTDALYARDVLLVCDALHDSEGPALAKRFQALLALKNKSAERTADPRAKPTAAPQRPERRVKGLRDRRRQRMRLPPGRERRRGQRRTAEAEHVAVPVAPKSDRKAAPAPRIFSAIFGHTTQPPDQDMTPDRAATPDAPRRWFGRRSGPR